MIGKVSWGVKPGKKRNPAELGGKESAVKKGSPRND